MTTKSDLLAAHELFENSRNWTKGLLWEQRSDGEWCYCLTGGLMVVTGFAVLDEFAHQHQMIGDVAEQMRYRHARYSVEQALWAQSETLDVILWNDAQTTTHPMLLNLLEWAIDLTP